MNIQLCLKIIIIVCPFGCRIRGGYRPRESESDFTSPNSLIYIKLENMTKEIGENSKKFINKIGKNRKY